MLCKDHNVVPTAFKFYNVWAFRRNSFFSFYTVNELKLDSEIKKIESYSSFSETSRKS